MPFDEDKSFHARVRRLMRVRDGEHAWHVYCPLEDGEQWTSLIAGIVEGSLAEDRKHVADHYLKLLDESTVNP